MVAKGEKDESDERPGFEIDIFFKIRASNEKVLNVDDYLLLLLCVMNDDRSWVMPAWQS